MARWNGLARGHDYGHSGYRGYALVVLTLIYSCHTIDRALPNILVEPIRQEFNLTDGQLGLFSGLAFAIAFSVAILPMGYLADRLNRRNLLAAALFTWSLLTALSGTARSFMHLLLARVGLGVAEAGGSPLTVAIISDIFPANRRGSAFGVFYMASPFGTLVAAGLGGYIAAEHGWRAAFFIAGVPGIVLALLLLATIREPKRGAVDAAAGPPLSPEPQKASFSQAVTHFVRKPALFYLLAAIAIVSLLNIALSTWMASFFIRVHGLGLAQVGLILGVGGGLCGMAAPPLFGWLSDRLSPRDRRWPLRLNWLAGLVALGLLQVLLFTPSLMVAIVCYVTAEVLRFGFFPPAFSVLMNETPAHLRGSVMSIVQFATNLVGYGLGPVLTGVLSDQFGGGTAIRYALACVSLLLLLVTILLMLAARGLFKAQAEV